MRTVFFFQKKKVEHEILQHILQVDQSEQRDLQKQEAGWERKKTLDTPVHLLVVFGMEKLRFNVQYPQFLVPLTHHQRQIVVQFMNTKIYQRLDRIFMEEILAEIIDQM